MCVCMCVSIFIFINSAQVHRLVGISKMIKGLKVCVVNIESSIMDEGALVKTNSL